MRFDFHLHTRYSDGTLSPVELLEKLKNNGVCYFAITDHDTLSAHRELETQAANSMKKFVGVEINTSENTETLHILGFGSRLLSNEVFLKQLSVLRTLRVQRAEAMVGNLQALGFEITMEDVRKKSQESIGRPHVADALKAKGIVQTREEAFRRFLLKGKPGYSPPLGPRAREAIASIADAGGVPVLAHPGIAGMGADKLVSLVDMGLKGIEAYHSCHKPSDVREYLEFARRHDLFVTCGSDYHGPDTGRQELTAYEFDEAQFFKFLEAIS
ncbi:MAG: PHP domain-containing protein [Elusimicrobia bacterium]|nr:PHP domain-containing protein [Elusimicrobiota bacterium]